MKRNKSGAGDVLELYDGQMALPNRKLIADNVPPLKFTARGKELFALSESLYGKWLQGEKGEDAVERAVELCRLSVEEGYPHAVVKMAFYYDKDYIATDRTEEFRCRVACDYYGKVVYCEETPPCDEDVTPEIGWTELKNMAARMLLDMLAHAPRALEEYGGGRYSYAYHCDRLRESVGTVPVASCERTERDREKFAAKVFYGCKHNKVRAPLFGVIQLSAGQAQSLFAAGGDTIKLSGDINIWLWDGSRTVRVNSTSAFNRFLGSLGSAETWAFFFNNERGGHGYLNASQRKAACELMMKDGFSRYHTLVGSARERGRSEYLFSDDDVQFFMTGRINALKTALDDLIKKVTGDRDWSDRGEE